MKTIADRISESGIPIEKISETSGISKNRILECIAGADPSLHELRRLAAALKLNVSDFIVDSGVQHRANFLFRQTLPRNRMQGLRFIDSYSRQIGYSFEVLDTRQKSLLPFEDFKVERYTYEEADTNAARFRSLFYGNELVSPLLSLPSLVMERLQTILFVLPEQSVDGASAIIDGQAFIFVSPRFAPRMLFTLAHELGHLIAHHGKGQEFATIDFEDQTGRIKRSVKKPEAFADTFAGCLLLPKEGVGIALKKIRELVRAQSDSIGDVELLYLSRIFGVSFQAAAVRCEDLDLLPSGGAISLYEQLRKDYGSPEKRAESINLPPRPKIAFPTVSRRLLLSAINKIRNGEISIGRASNALNLSINDIMLYNAESTH